jgi:hypothetical protein
VQVEEQEEIQKLIMHKLEVQVEEQVEVVLEEVIQVEQEIHHQ